MARLTDRIAVVTREGSRGSRVGGAPKARPVAAFVVAAAIAAAAHAASAPSMADILKNAPPTAWRLIDPARTLYLDLPTGRVIIELSPSFAPHHVENVVKLVRAGFFDGLTVVRVQDDYVAQWGDADATKPLGGAEKSLKPEFDRPYGAAESFSLLPDRDVYAPRVGFSDGFPAARDPATRRSWLTHCYGMVGVGRDVGADSGSGMELYAVIGHAPRHLDRNVTLVGRVVRGIEVLSSLPRGTGDLGFYKTVAEHVSITRVRLAADLPLPDQIRLEALRTDSSTFAALLQNRRFRRDEWYKTAAGRIDLCNMPLPVRDK